MQGPKGVLVCAEWQAGAHHPGARCRGHRDDASSAPEHGCNVGRGRTPSHLGGVALLHGSSSLRSLGLGLYPEVREGAMKFEGSPLKLYLMGLISFHLRKEVT